MAQVICHHEGKYNIYCTIPDGFIFEGPLTLSLVKRHFIDKNIDTTIINRRIARAIKTGHSSLEYGSLEDFLCCNRAGKNESTLTFDECISQFFK